MLFRDCFQHLQMIERKRIVMSDNIVMRLNRGEWPEQLPQELIHHIDNNSSTYLLHTYPDYGPFYEKLSAYIGFPKKQIVVGAGIEEFIRTLMFLCCDPGEKAAVLWPTCAMYDIYALAFGVDLVRIKPEPGKPFWSKSKTITDLLEDTHSEDIRVLFLPNPGQPVETYFDLHELEQIASWCALHDIVFVVDEAHFGFGAVTALPLVEQFNNLLVMRTFSKFFGAASIRVGFCVGQERVIKPLHAVRPSGEITGFSIMVASILMDSVALLEESARETAKARDWLRETVFAQLGLNSWGQWGFSVLIEFASMPQVCEVAAALARQGIYVKFNFPPPVDKCMLVACGSMKLMQCFFDALKENYRMVVRD